MMQWGSAFWSTLRETAPFLVFGLLLAGVLHVLVPPRIILWALGYGGWKGAVRGALIGMPLPLSSCGVIPTSLTLRRQGASLSATTAFTVSTPETSIDALAVTAALLPSVFLGVRPLAALVLAISVGILVEIFSTTDKEQLRINVLNLSRVMDGEKPVAGAREANQPEAEVCRVCGLMSAEGHRHGKWAKIRAIFSYSFGTFFKDIATWLLLGLVFATLIEIAVPNSVFQAAWFKNHSWVQILIAIAIGIPLYSCATLTTPLVAVLLTKGLNPGAALVLLLSGPATNIGNVFVLKREFGGKITFVYYAGLFVLCALLGAVFNWFWPITERRPWMTQVAGFGGANQIVHGIPGWLEVLSAWILLVLVARIWITAFMKHDGKTECDSEGRRSRTW